MRRFVDFDRKIVSIAQNLESCIQQAVLEFLHPSSVNRSINELCDILSHMHILENIRANTSIRAKVHSLSDLVKALHKYNISEMDQYLHNCKKAVSDFWDSISAGTASTGGQFEWIDSVLVTAVAEGHWLLIDNANFCSPSVLDRLNSLLEPNGALVISEQGVVGDKLRTVTPNQNFRIFLTMNPKNGEISQAMRNRGVEIFVEPISSDPIIWRRSLDISSFSQCKGLNHSIMIAQLYALHDTLCKDDRFESPSLTDFLSAASLCAQFLQRHDDPRNAFFRACESVYASNSFNFNLKKGIIELITIRVQKFPPLPRDVSIPITALLPTTFDYRHSIAFATMQKEAAIFKYFLSHFKNFLRMQEESAQVSDNHFPYPTPNYLLSTSINERFFCIIRMMLESCSVQSHGLLDIWLQTTLEQEIKHEPNNKFKDILQSCLQLKSVLGEQLNDEIVLELLNVVSEIYDHAGNLAVKKYELPIDPRWKPDICRRLMLQLRQSSDNESDDSIDTDMIEFKVFCCANKFNLLLLLRTLEFTTSSIPRERQMLSLIKSEKVSRYLQERGKRTSVVKSIPHFLNTIPDILLGILRKEMDCTDQNYWKFRDILYSYYVCRQICEQPIQIEESEHQLIVFIAHFYWLWKKVKKLYEPEKDIPPALENCFHVIDRCISYKSPELMFRLRFVKKNKYPLGFSTEEAANLYYTALRCYNSISWFNHLNKKEPILNDLKKILAYRSRWMDTLSEQVYKSVFSAFLENINYIDAINNARSVELQFNSPSSGDDDDDDVKEISQIPVEIPAIPNEIVKAEIQMLPLLDYIFNIYTAELFHPSNLPIDIKKIYELGAERICAHPQHLAHISRYHYLSAQSQIISVQEVSVLLMTSFLSHIRHGFSSKGLNFLHCDLTDGESGPTIVSPVLTWDSSNIWSKQAPLLTFICSSVMERHNGSSFVCEVPLRTYTERLSQLEFTKAILWNNLEKLSNPLLSIRCATSRMINAWFFNLISGVEKTLKRDLSDDSFSMEFVKFVFKETGLDRFVVTEKEIDILPLAFESVRELNTRLKDHCESVMYLSSKAFILVGLLTVMLMLPRDVIDPAVKREIKAKDLENRHQDLLMEFGLRDWISKITTGLSLGDIAFTDCTPYIKNLQEICEITKKRLIALNRKLVCRDKNGDKFERLKDSMRNYMVEVSSPDSIIEIISHFDQIYYSEFCNQNLVEYDVILKAKSQIENQRHFVESVSRNYCGYEDLTVPFLLGVEQITHGIQLALQSIALKKMNSQLKSKYAENVADFLSQFISTPMDCQHNSLDIVHWLVNRENIDSFKNILSLCDVPTLKGGRLICKLLKSALLEIIVQIKRNPTRSKSESNNILTLLSSTLGIFWQTWSLQEMQIKKKEEEKDNLYKYKAKLHEGELTEEEAIKKQILNSFPSFRNAYADLLRSNEDDEETPLENMYEELTLEPYDAFQVWQLHATIMSLLLPNELNNYENMNWIIDEFKTVNSSTPYLLRYEVVCEVLKSAPDNFDGVLDQKLVVGHLMMCNELQKMPELKENDFYDIYRSPNPNKILQLYPVLTNLEDNLKVLLNKYPEEPRLLQILNIVKRVLSLPVTDPVMKFAAGLELILESMQLWKEVLKSDREKVAEKIIEFRSLELNVWRKGLDSVIQKQQRNCTKWWFHMFGLFATSVKNSKDDDEFKSLISSLKQFLDDSSLGEFPARLSILHIFLLFCRLSNFKKTYRKLEHLLFNLYGYYKQFLPDVNNQISQIRKPIDKELKDFVKIARWKDVNFEALRNSVNKSHYFIVKHTKAFEDALKMPAKKVFTIPSKQDLADGPTWTLNIKKSYFLSASSEMLVEDYFQEREGLFQGMPQRYKRLKKLTKKISKSFNVTNHINTLNDFCGTVIEALQNVTLDLGKKMCTRSQEKKQTLILIQKKRQMLATLFKNLRVMGLSYRHGMISAKNSNVDSMLMVPAFDPSQMKMMKLDRKFEELVLKTSEDSEHYFYKSIAQYAQLQKYMELPSKELTLDIIHRINGYSCNMVQHVVSARETIVKVAANIDRIGCFFFTLSDIKKSQEKCLIIPPENDVAKMEGILNNLMVQYLAVIQQLGFLMNCTPDSFKGNYGEIPCIYNDKKLLSSLNKSNPIWNEISKSIIDCTTELEKGFDVIYQSVSNTMVFTSWEKFSEIVKVFKVMLKSLSVFLNSLKGFNVDQNQQLTRNLIRLTCKIQDESVKTLKEYNVLLTEAKEGEKRNQANQDNVQNQNLSTLIHKITIKILMAYQDIITSSVSCNEKDTSEDNMCPDNLITNKILVYLSDFEKNLHFHSITKLIVKLQKELQQSFKSKVDIEAIDDSIRLLLNLLPVFDQYFQLVKIYFVTNLGMHRTSCKFLTILLEIFNLLATKGFCIPPELQEEASKADGTKFEDIESGGLDEGEGIKDVSDKIETEDQLDDTFKAGQEKKKEEEEKDIKDEEKGIEMSEDFEGKSYNPENNLDESEGSGDEEKEDLDKQMGDVDGDDTDRLDDKVWGSDSEDDAESEISDTDDAGGAPEGKSELTAKDSSKEDLDKKSSMQNPKENMLGEQNEEYQGEFPDPLIDAPPNQEPEYVDLPEDMEINDEDGGKENLDGDDEEITYDPNEDLESKVDESEDGELNNDEEEDTDNGSNQIEEDGDVRDGTSAEPVPENDVSEKKKNESCLPTHTPTTEKDAQSTVDQSKSSSLDPVQDDSTMEWESGAQKSDEQHEEGQADAKNSHDQSGAHEGKKSSAKQMTAKDQQYEPKLRPPAENRTLDDNPDYTEAKNRPISDKQSLQKSTGTKDDEEDADMYEHVQNKEEGMSKAMDIASEEQAAMKPANEQDDADKYKEEIIELSSDDDEEYYSKEESTRTQGDVISQDQRQRRGQKGNFDDDQAMDITPEGEVIRTHTVARGNSTVHTNQELWASLSFQNMHNKRLALEKDLDLFYHSDKEQSENTVHLWRKYEDLVVHLSQELCEQLRLVLEPTKMSKLKGDYRTGKRIAMRKIIPYIASGYRKDKIWLRRTKPSKRQYQIMIAVDDSSSMADNHSKELTFESLATLGQSLSLLEAGELSVISFGEKVELLLGFNEQFNTNTGAGMFSKFTFNQQKTRYIEMVKFATDAMVQARNTNAMMCKETAQLLVILSDGRGVFSEGDTTMIRAVREARDNNIFMVFIVTDSPESENSILDIKTTKFEGDKVFFKKYIEDFPFPFYIILRDISSLPTILGGALRQWFELVTSTER
ncbi:midasin [Trichonephila clavata]|uniref:Midasin n=1 Tax=Trichonephila clavata TaxID=2740835 RepID=A0A8X6FR80_TRICU|nr:midasin [Trichonephila clavata]